MSTVHPGACSGTCPGFENNNRCDVPSLCAPDTDCYDCRSGFLAWYILVLLLTFGFSALLFAAVLVSAKRMRERPNATKYSLQVAA